MKARRAGLPAAREVVLPVTAAKRVYSPEITYAKSRKRRHSQDEQVRLRVTEEDSGLACDRENGTWVGAH